MLHHKNRKEYFLPKISAFLLRFVALFATVCPIWVAYASSKISVHTVYAPVSKRVSPRTESSASGDAKLQNRSTVVLAVDDLPIGRVRVLGLKADPRCALLPSNSQASMIQADLEASVNAARAELEQYTQLKRLGLQADFVLVNNDCAFQVIERLPKTSAGAWHIRFYVPVYDQALDEGSLQRWLAGVMDLLVHEGLHLDSQLAKLRRDLFLEELIAYWRGLCVRARAGVLPQFPAKGPLSSYGPSAEMREMVADPALRGYQPGAAAYFITGRLWIGSFADQEAKSWNEDKIRKFCEFTPSPEVLAGLSRISGFERFLLTFDEALAR